MPALAAYMSTNSAPVCFAAPRTEALSRALMVAAQGSRRQRSGSRLGQVPVVGTTRG